VIEDFIFVHIPRTGGETIEILLGVKKNHYQVRHRGLLSYESTFSFVRNPYTRLYSWYSHLRIPLYINEIELTGLNEQSDTFRLAKKKVFGHKIHSKLAMKHNFNDWVKIMMSDKIKYTKAREATGPLITCCDYLRDEDGKLVIGNLYYFENYNEELARLFTEIDRKDLIPKIEVTNQSKKPVPGEISEETKEMIYDHFKIDFTTFGYEK
jgi:hypothetical protein